MRHTLAATVPTAVISTMRWDVFISHDWDARSPASDLCRLLERAGITAWHDATALHGDIVHAMTTGIDHADVVIVGVTHNYVAKCSESKNDNCQLELDYSYRRKGAKRLLPVLLEGGLCDTAKWGGKVGAYLGGTLYFDCSSTAKMHIAIPRIICTIRRLQNKTRRWTVFVHIPRRRRHSRVTPDNNGRSSSHNCWSVSSPKHHLWVAPTTTSTGSRGLPGSGGGACGAEVSTITYG